MLSHSRVRWSQSLLLDEECSNFIEKKMIVTRFEAGFSSISAFVIEEKIFHSKSFLFADDFQLLFSCQNSDVDYK